MYKCSLEVHLEDGLIGLKHHARLHLKVFVQVHPGTVRTLLATKTVREHPRLLILEELDRCLVLREKSIINADGALRRSSNNNGLALILIIVNLACGRTSEDFELQFALAIVIVDVYTRL